MTWIIAVMDTRLSVDPSRLLSLSSRYRALYQARPFMLIGRRRVRLVGFRLFSPSLRIGYNIRLRITSRHYTLRSVLLSFFIWWLRLLS